MVTNSYNLGTVTGAAGKTYGISSNTVVNSYTIDLTAGTGRLRRQEKCWYR